MRSTGSCTLLTISYLGGQKRRVPRFGGIFYELNGHLLLEINYKCNLPHQGTCINLFCRTLFWPAAKHHVPGAHISTTCSCLPPNRQYDGQHFIYCCTTKPKLVSHMCCTTEVKTQLLSLRIPWNVTSILMKIFWLKLLFTPSIWWRKIEIFLIKIV